MGTRKEIPHLIGHGFDLIELGLFRFSNIIEGVAGNGDGLASSVSLSVISSCFVPIPIV